jgi:hypothetical protein
VQPWCLLCNNHLFITINLIAAYAIDTWTTGQFSFKNALKACLKHAQRHIQRVCAQRGCVCRSSRSKNTIACSRELPHMSGDGMSDAHTAGLSGCPNIWQPRFASSWIHGVKAGLPSGMPGIGELMEGAVQQAAQWGRHCISCSLQANRMMAWQCLELL